MTGSITNKPVAVAFSLLMIGAVASPVVRNWRGKPRDSFPLSHYPMFSQSRSKAARVTYLVGFDAQGKRRKIPYRFAGQGGLNQVRKQIGKLVDKGDSRKLCEEVARNIAATAAATPGVAEAELVTVRISTGSYDLTGYFTGKRLPLSETTHATCSVPHGPAPSGSAP